MSGEIRLQAELQRMLEETRKFVAEAHKLEAERRKLDRDRWLAPLIAIGAGVGSLIGASSLVWRLLHG
jgi:hypothetical protein